MGTIFDWIGKKLPKRKKLRPDIRTVYVGGKHPPGADAVVPEKFPTNRIISSKYTAWNFIPKNIFEQFHRIANFYFLCVALISVFIDSPVSPWTSIVPLIFVIAVTAVKQGYEDWLRHKSDNEVNYKPAKLIRDGKLVTVKAMDIRVGDIVYVESNDMISCDFVMLSSDDPDGNCSITTANLDGETNLKTFSATGLTRHCQTERSFDDLYAVIECQQPIADLYKFKGRVKVYDRQGGSQMASLGAENVILRGARLKNTGFVYGCCVYTGQETKISINSMSKSSKFSRVEVRMNKFLIIFLIFLLIYPAVWVGVKHWFFSLDENKAMWYTEPEPDATFGVILGEYLGFMVIMNYIIPISMYVTVELQKFFGSMFFDWDVEMYDELSDEPAKALTSDLNEELGQVEYLFSDKTGTLTENDMQFRQCTVNAVKYEDVGGVLCFQSTSPTIEPQRVARLPADLEDLLIALALCNTVRVAKKDAALNNDTMNRTQQKQDKHRIYEYTASSPDEKALVEACQRYGVIFTGVKHDWAEVLVCGKLQKYKQRHMLDFDPTRKRMSVIIEDEKGSKYVLSKGAETAILPRCRSGDVESVERHITDYAKLGLRTLCIARRRLNSEEFDHLDQLLKNARTAMDDRDAKLQVAYEEVEVDLELLGATAVEDRLQDGVPETIAALREAGIQVWVLTGDKEETAINISYSAGHFNENMIELKLTKMKNTTEVGDAIDRYNRTLEQFSRMGERKHALVVDGQTLLFALQDHAPALQQLCQRVVTVLCCRMSPMQKAQVVKLMKESEGHPTTAAIGDGANDVSMIQEAHVGLAIMGKEGRQAVRCSDYAFGRFRFLRRALFVHGHYFYVRLAVLVQYFFYKNVAMITSELYFTFFSAFTYQTVFESFFLTFYNITFCALPPIVYALFERNLPDRELMTQPQLYKINKKNGRLTYSEFLRWNLMGLWHSLVFFFGTYFAVMPDQAPDSDAKQHGIFEFGAIIMTTCVITVNIKLMLETYYWNGVVVFSFALTFIGGYFGILFIYSCVYWPVIFPVTFYGGFVKILSSAYVWFMMIGMTILALIPDIVWRAYVDISSESLAFARGAKKEPADQMSQSISKRSGKLTFMHKNKGITDSMLGSLVSSANSSAPSSHHSTPIFTTDGASRTIVNTSAAKNPKPVNGYANGNSNGGTGSGFPTYENVGYVQNEVTIIPPTGRTGHGEHTTAV